MDHNSNIPEGRDGMDDRLGKALGGALGRALGHGPAGGACPPLEDLAALAEGTITGSERDTLLAHMAACGRCREVYAMACDIAPAVVNENTDEESAPAEAAAKVGVSSPPPPHLRGRGAWGLGGSLPSTRPAARPVAEAGHTTAGRRREKPAPVCRTGVCWQTRYLAPAALAASILIVVLNMPTMPGRQNNEQDTVSQYTPPATAQDGKKATASPGNESAYKDAGIPAPAPTGGAKDELVVGYGSDGVKAKSIAASPRFSVEPETSGREDGARTVVASPPPQPAPAETRVAEAPPARQPMPSARISLDERLKLALGRLDNEVSDRDDIASLFKEMKLPDRDFRLGDVKKVVIQWPGGVRTGSAGNAALPGPARASVTLGDGGVLTIVIKRERAPTTAVGC